MTGFDDVIEYNTPSGSAWRHGGVVEFNFRVARVSRSQDPRGRPLLEKMITIRADTGEIAEETNVSGEPYGPQQYHYKFDQSIPFTDERYLKFKMFREAIDRLHALLVELLEDQDTAPGKLDAIASTLPRLLGEASE